MRSESRELLDTVINQGYCIGCGACALVSESPFKVDLDKYGNMLAFPDGDVDQSKAEVLEVCPFSGKSKNEDELGELFFKDNPVADGKIGKYLSNYAGFVQNEAFRSKGSSGGLGKWLGYVLLEKGLIDYFIQVVPNQSRNEGELLFEYKVIEKKEEVLTGSKSSYYPVSLVQIMDFVRAHEGRYAITGVPCFIKTLRLMSLKEELLRQRISYTIGIVCGGMKSANQSKMIGWQLGVKPENLIRIDFRRKHANKPAKYKIYQVWSSIDDKERFRDSYDIYGTDFGAGYFKPKACDYCDDVVGETADISIGDAWLPEFVNDPKGTTITVVRNPELLKLIEAHIESGDLKLERLSSEDVITSQTGGFRHRREALSYRLALRESEKQWYPVKRVAPGSYNISRDRKRIYLLREKIEQQSHIEF